MNRAWSRVRWWKWVAVALLMIPAGWWLGNRASVGEDAEWVEVRRDDLVLAVELAGTLKAVDTNHLGPPQISNLWDYKISRLATEGAQVKVGEPVLGFDTSELERRLAEKKAESAAARKEIEKREIDLTIKRRDDELRLAEAEARRNKASLKVDRPMELAQANELQQARLDLALAEQEIAHLHEKMASEGRAADAELASLRERRDRAEARVREIEDSIERMTVVAPRAGTVIYVSDGRDEKKKVGDSCWRGEQVLEIPDLRRMKAVGEVDEADAGRLAVGQPVTLRLDAHPDVEFTGRVKSILGTVQRKSWDNPLKVVRLDIELDRTDTERMRPGMRFTGSIEAGRLSRVLLVAAEAVFPTPDGPVAYRRTRFGTEEVRLDLGKRTEKVVQVLGGLTRGERVSRRNLGTRREPS